MDTRYPGRSDRVHPSIDQSTAVVAGGDAQGHFGLNAMQNRAPMLGGRCEVRPRPGGGTIVALDLPIA